MKALGGIFLWLSALCAVGLGFLAWRIGLNGLFGEPSLMLWVGFGAFVGAIAFLALGLMLTAPAGPKAPKAAKPPKPEKKAKGGGH